MQRIKQIISVLIVIHFTTSLVFAEVWKCENDFFINSPINSDNCTEITLEPLCDKEGYRYFNHLAAIQANVQVEKCRNNFVDYFRSFTIGSLINQVSSWYQSLTRIQTVDLKTRLSIHARENNKKNFPKIDGLRNGLDMKDGSNQKQRIKSLVEYAERKKVSLK